MSLECHRFNFNLKFHIFPDTSLTYHIRERSSTDVLTIFSFITRLYSIRMIANTDKEFQVFAFEFYLFYPKYHRVHLNLIQIKSVPMSMSNKVQCRLPSGAYSVLRAFKIQRNRKSCCWCCCSFRSMKLPHCWTDARWSLNNCQSLPLVHRTE